MAGAKKPLRILGLADLHDRIDMLDRLKGIDADLIVFCGDLHNASSKIAARPAALALARLGHPVLIIPGNMDHRDVVPDLWDEAGLRMIHRSSFCLGDIGFLGMGGMVAKDPRRLGDPSRYYHNDIEVYETLAAVYQNIISARIKIVAVHQPPRGVQDTLYNGESSGSVSLRRFVEEYQPDLLLCGHIHEARGMGFIGTTRIVNVGELRQGCAALIEIGDEITVNWI
ncbi:MAG: metallophosphoesterase [Methanothrix sp.]|nr:metallophosphoesterase [Methanothrix sp.]MDD4446744.1 metallophosphoesterase [Methanothrix sp.]